MSTKSELRFDGQIAIVTAKRLRVRRPLKGLEYGRGS
jgi:hypothetical protein